jgi:type I restriction enzyme, R subunit
MGKEYSFVEEPFLNQLQTLGWDIINHGSGIIPFDPKVSLRDNFREIVIKSEFKKYVKSINKTEDGQEWLTDKQLEDLYRDITKVNFKSLLEANKALSEIIIHEKPRVDKNYITGEENVAVKLIDFDFDTIENNHFLAINQFRIDTVGTAKKYIIPDIVLFVNGIPLVVVECKYPQSFAADAMEEGIKQLLRYQNRRLNNSGSKEKEGEEQLFYYNQFVISTYGDEARCGTVSSDYEHFLTWKTVYPKKLDEYKKENTIHRSQEILIQGMLDKDNFLKIIRNFTIFKPVSESSEIKIVCRYQQFRAVGKIINKLLLGKSPYDRSGVIWHTQGSGKSLTMVFLVRQLRDIKDIKDYKVVMVNDRTELEEQLGETANLTGETVHYVEKRNQLDKLKTQSSDLTLVMMHKFGDKKISSEILEDLKAFDIDEEDVLPEVEELGVINDSDRILILIDESHRTQNNPFGLAGNLFKAFPNSTKIAFTGTPLITDRHKNKTVEIFGGEYIDTYKAKDSVADGATLQILYLGRKNKFGITLKEEFNADFDETFKKKSKKEIEAIKKKYGSYFDFLESDNHIKDVAYDIVNHYSSEILKNGFKGQVVCVSKNATAKYKYYLDEAIEKKIEELENQPYERDEELLKRLKFIKTVVVVSDGGNDSADVVRLSKASKALDAVENFKKAFDYDKEDTGIALLIVCSRLLTGFDAPVEQVMYLDKPMKEHTLFQAITRVNRTKKDKYKGWIVDYIGIHDKVIETLAIYSGDNEDEQGQKTFDDINSEIPILEDRYNRLINIFKDKGVSKIEEYVLLKVKDAKDQIEILEKCIEVCKDEQFREKFKVFYKKYLMSLDVLYNTSIDEKYIMAMNSFGHIQARVKHRYKDETINLMGVSEKIKSLINKYTESYGISNQTKPIELFDVDFKEKLEKENETTKAKASEMEHATRKELTINKDLDPVYYGTLFDKLEAILKTHELDAEARYKALEELYEKMKKGRTKEESSELDPDKEAPFYDLLVTRFFEVKPEGEKKEKIVPIVIGIVDQIIHNIKKVRFWEIPSEIGRLAGIIEEELMLSGIDELEENEEEIAKEFINLAKKRHEILVRKYGDI